MLQLNELSFRTGGQTILREITLLLTEGEKVVINGPSGCGKSSLLKMIAGAIRPDRGSIHFNGRVLDAESIGEIRAAVAFIGQEPTLAAATVREALLLPFGFKAHAHNRPTENQLTETIARLHLSAGILDKETARISGGEKQRVAIARAFLLQKRIFVADEITSALDPVSTAAVIHELFRPEFTVISASHDPDWIHVCDRTIEMKAGQLVGESYADD